MTVHQNTAHYDAANQSNVAGQAIMTDGANYVFDLLLELQKIADASGMVDLSEDIGKLVIAHRPLGH